MTAEPIILHGARVYPAVHDRPEMGPPKHTASIKPLDPRRSRPCGWWMHDENTGLLHGFAESLRGHLIRLDGLELDDVIQRTVEAVDA